MFEKTLTDVVKGIRSSKRDTGLYISQCIAEIKLEIASTDLQIKANALQKLTFLQMMGYSMNYASFATIEVMSSPKFAHKRIGYLAASQGFKQDTEVILLSTNLLQKELRKAVGNGGSMHGVYEAALAINCLSNIITEDLARDLLPELTSLTTHPQPYLRKKAILCLFKLFVKYPQALRLTFERIQQCLEDTNSSVVSCAVNVITELSDKNPKNYLHLAPQFFRLLTNSSNNWMLIKVVKLLGSLVPEEPRLARKLLDPLADIVRNTQAKSLLYEAVRTITLCLPYCRKADGSMPSNVPEIVELCASTLKDFVEQSDQNLKYLGLVGYGSLMQSHPKVLSAPAYRPLILACLSDPDITIRNRALELVPGMVSRKNLIEFVTQLLDHVELATSSYKHNLVAKIIEMCAADKYSNLQDFAWYLDVLFQLGHMRGLETLGSLLCSLITDVAVRVLPARPYAVRRCIEILLEDKSTITNNNTESSYDGTLVNGDNGRGKHIMAHILPAIAWIIGEYSDLIRDAMSIDPNEKDTVFSYNGTSSGTYHAIIQCLLNPINSESLQATTQKVYVQAALKVLSAAASDRKVTETELTAIIDTLQQNLPIFVQSTDVEVMERSFAGISLLQSLELFNSSNTLDTSSLLLMKTDDDSKQQQEVEEINQNGDLLGISGTAPISLPAPTLPKQTGNNGLTATLSTKRNVRNQSDILKYILKPSPMKPTGAKTQRKKRNMPIGITSIDFLDAPVNSSIFNDLISTEESLQVGRKICIESVTFTQQQPMNVTGDAAMSTVPVGSTNTSLLNTNTTTNASSSIMNKSAPLSGGPTNRQNDPFYLASNTTGQDTGLDSEQQQNRFGTIQLLDSDDDDSESPHQRKKKKKNKKDKSSKKGMPHGMSSTKADEFIVYDADEDDVDEKQQSKPIGKKKPGKEFEGLARVDLLSPLRDDEVMPERKHHVVPERPVVPVQVPEAPKREKKSSKPKKKSSSKNGKTPDTTGDLLDLGDFGSASVFKGSQAASLPTQTATLPSTASGGNAINLAFDDLLGISLSPPVTLNTGGTSNPSANAPDISLLSLNDTKIADAKTKAKRPWLKATVKSSNDAIWSQISILYRPHRSKQGKSVASLLSIRIKNESANPLQNVSLTLPGLIPISFGLVGPGSLVESEKVGPFTYSAVDTNQEIKGSVTANGISCSVKVALPISFHFNPESNIKLEDIARELVSTGWYSHSAKVDIFSTKNPSDVKNILSSFFRADEVEGSAMNVNTGTYAAISSQKARIRILIKIKDNSVKVDVKSTTESIAKALVSDIKRITL